MRSLDKAGVMHSSYLTLLTLKMLGQNAQRHFLYNLQPTHTYSQHFWWTLQAANLSDHLSEPNLVATVFAPTNDAFSKALSQYGVTPSQALQQARLVRGVSLQSIT